MPEKLVIATGFGPFKEVKVNPSWEAVKKLPNEVDHNGIQYKVEKLPVAVQYDDVDKMVEKIWDKKPELVIHCGVHRSASLIHLEKIAKNNVEGHDVCGVYRNGTPVCLPNHAKCEQLQTELHVDNIVDNLNKSCETKIFAPSANCGSYLCDYIYLKSLDKCCTSTLFVHVPGNNKALTIPKLSDAILNVIKECLDDVLK